MAISVVMPALELTQETGKLVAWRKKEGERVAKGEPLVDVETDKAVVEIEAPADGFLFGIKAVEGAVIPVGRTIAWIVQPGENPPPQDTTPESPSPASARPARPDEPHATVETPKQDERGPKISPKARRLAREHGIDIHRLRGSGREGEIVAADVLTLVESQTAPARSDVVTLSSVGRLMAERTTQSWTSVPHFFLVREVEAGGLVEAREKLGSAVEQAVGVRPSHTDLLVALVARVLRKHPRLNASWAGSRAKADSPQTVEGIRLNPEVNIGVAVAVKDGVVAAVIQNADKAELSEIAVQRRELTERARTGRLRPSDIAGATFTISNLGMYHVDAFSAIIAPPQAAILAVGRIAERVVPVHGRPGIRPMMTFTLSCDHRVVDGTQAAAFLNELADAIRDPEKWLH